MGVIIARGMRFYRPPLRGFLKLSNSARKDGRAFQGFLARPDMSRPGGGLERRPDKRTPVFGKPTRQNKALERADDSRGASAALIRL